MPSETSTAPFAAYTAPVEQSATAAPSPIPQDERVDTLDVIRGFALWGVCLANLVPWFSGYETLSDDAKHAFATWPADRVTQALLTAFVHGRFITIFSFLFGLGFAVQYVRAEARGANADRLLARRLAAMLAIGVAHAYLVWYGDILAMYAVIGVVLLVARRWSVRWLLAVGVALAVLQPIGSVGYSRLAPALATPVDSAGAPTGAARPATPEPDTVHTVVLPRLVTQRSYGAILEANRRMYVAFFQLPGTTPFLVQLAGLFLLGLCVGRSGLLRTLGTHRDRWWLAFGWSATLALFCYLPRLGLTLAGVPPARVPQDVVGMLRTLRFIGLPAMSMAYMCGIVLLMQRGAWRRRLMALAPVGRMALTNYLTQSFVAIAVFYGVGFAMFGRIGPTVQVAMSVAIIAVQAVLSRWWLTRFRFGPAEWLWRSMTYGRSQPMRVAAR